MHRSRFDGSNYLPTGKVDLAAKNASYSSGLIKISHSLDVEDDVRFRVSSKTPDNCHLRFC